MNTEKKIEESDTEKNNLIIKLASGYDLVSFQLYDCLSCVWRLCIHCPFCYTCNILSVPYCYCVG